MRLTRGKWLPDGPSYRSYLLQRQLMHRALGLPGLETGLNLKP